MFGFLTRKPKMHRPTRHVEFCPVTFEHGGNRYCGYMIDLSVEGAKIRTSIQNGRAGLRPDEEIAFKVKTPYGFSNCKGTVRWSEQYMDGRTVWGVNFTEIPSERTDPIRSLIESPMG